MIDFLEVLAAQHKDDESIKAFNEIKNHLLDKKYGLVWEEHSEKVDEMMSENIPVFTEDNERKITSDKDLHYNFILEGDNLQSLSLLEKTHKGKIKCIYIDPPYNRCQDDFIYNDKIINKEDSYLHSKWLSFMHKRLSIAKKLLTDNGVMFISIDDYEYTNLKMLCDEIFGESYVDTMVWRKSGVGRDGKMKNTTTFRKDHEYIVVCFNSQKNLNKSFEKPMWENVYPNLDNDPRGGYKAGSISRKEEASNQESSKYYSVTSPSGKVFTRQFDVTQEEFERLDKDNRIYWGVNGDAVPAVKIFQNEKREVTTSSYIIESSDYLSASSIDERESTTTQGSKELEDILNAKGLGQEMRPKPIELIYKLIQIGTNKDDIVLDFFAGSGTTAQAVMQLNMDDEGNRKVILCTNNESKETDKIEYFIKKGLVSEKPRKNTTSEKEWLEKWADFTQTDVYKNEIEDKDYQALGICHKVTYPRVKTVITGIRQDGSKYSDGIAANLKYFKCTWTTRKPEDYLLSNALSLHIKEMIELQNAIEIDQVKNILILNKNDFKQTILNSEIYDKIDNIWINQNILFNAEEMNLLKNKGFKYIPKEFFGQELKEVAE